MHTGKSGRLFVGAVALALCCGGPPGADDTAVDVKVQPLDEETQIHFIALGRSSSTFMAFGGRAAITPADAGIVRNAHLSFEGIPEGDYTVWYMGYHQLPSFPERTGFRIAWLCFWEISGASLRVVSGQRNLVDLEPAAVANRCVFFAGDRYVVNPNYVADANHSHYGAIDHENTLGLFIHGGPPNAAVTVQACDTTDPSCTSPFGLFQTLPDGALNPWPAHTGSGWPRELTVTTNGLGDATLWAVVKPGADPVLWDIDVFYPTGTVPARERFRVRVSNGNSVEVHAE